MSCEHKGVIVIFRQCWDWFSVRSGQACDPCLPSLLLPPSSLVVVKVRPHTCTHTPVILHLLLLAQPSDLFLSWEIWESFVQLGINDYLKVIKNCIAWHVVFCTKYTKTNSVNSGSWICFSLPILSTKLNGSYVFWSVLSVCLASSFPLPPLCVAVVLVW